MVVRTALVDKRAGTSIISWLSRTLAIITSMTISWLSRPLAISISSIAISSIVSMQTLGASVCVAYGMVNTISRLGISGPLAISMSNIVSVGVLGRVVSISM